MLDWLWTNAEKLSALATAASFITVAYTLLVESRRFRRTLVLGVHGQLFQSNFGMLSMFLERSELREYFYEGRDFVEGSTRR